MKGHEYAAVGRRQVGFAVEGAERLSALYPDLDAVFLVEERSVPAMKRALIAALDAERDRGPLPEEAVARARAELGWNRKAERLLEIFRT
jgi:hypothetical protein